jgi:hypothetical protein
MEMHRHHPDENSEFRIQAHQRLKIYLPSHQLNHSSSPRKPLTAVAGKSRRTVVTKCNSAHVPHVITGVIVTEEGAHHVAGESSASGIGLDLELI